VIGNDIVDLRDSDARPTERTAAFDARVFSAAENERIESSDDSIRMRWLSWSAKESAYKLLRHYSGAVRFAPRRYAVGFESPGRAMGDPGVDRARYLGWVEAEGLRLVCEWVSDKDFVHALCRPEGSPLADRVGFKQLGEGACGPNRLSEAVRELALSEIGSFMGVDSQRLAIRKEDRIPGLWLDGTRLESALSLSHHGKRVAFAFRARGALLEIRNMRNSATSVGAERGAP